MRLLCMCSLAVSEAFVSAQRHCWVNVGLRRELYQDETNHQKGTLYEAYSPVYRGRTD